MVWTPEFWRSFKDRTSVFDGRDDYPQISHFIYPVIGSIFITALRFIIERHFFERLGVKNGLPSHKPPLKRNEILERAFRNSSRKELDNPVWIRDMAKKLDWKERQVEKWIRLRQDQNQPTELIYFTECGWRFTYHTLLFLIGLTVLWDKPWLWKINECWTDLPQQTISRDVWWYYMTHMSIYISHIYSQLLHWERNDFVEMFIHHLVTILLMTLSWTSNTVRIGTLVLVVHDCADIFMEAARIAKFLKFPRICSLCGVLFFLSWIVTRLGLFPFHILKNIWIDASVGILDSPVFLALTSLLHVLLGLHIFWSYFIFKIIYNFVTTGKIVDDSRSFSANLSGDEGKTS